jgi:hypothetical protein
MTQIKFDPPETPDNKWIDKQYSFRGRWIPAVDPALIGPENFATLQNLRFNDKSIEGVNGYTNVNDTTAISTYQGRVYQNTTAVGSEGDFDITTAFDAGTKTSTTNRGNAYFTDASTGLVGRFSASPQNSVVYCNKEENRIYSGREHRLAAAFEVLDHDTASVVDITDKLNSSLNIASSRVTLSANMITNGNMEADSNWNTVNGATDARSALQAKTGTYSWKFDSNGVDAGIKSDTFTTVADQEYRVVAHVYPDDTTNVKIRIARGSDGGAFTYEVLFTGLVQDAWNEITFTYTETSGQGGSSAYIQFDSGNEAGANNNWYIDDVTICKSDAHTHMVLMTTRPVQGFKFYVHSANTAVADLSCDNWTGSDWTTCTTVDDSDTDSPSGDALGKTGSLTFDHTVSTATFHHFEELYLYAYDVHFNDGSGAEATIYQVTCNPGFQEIQNVWDGVYRQPIQFQVYDVDHYEDFTLHVNESSDVNSPVGGILDGLVAATDHIIMMFEEQVSAARFTMLGDLVNAAASVIDIKYWNGYAWTATTGLIDGTLNLVRTDSFTQTGLLSWDTPSDEEQRTLFNSVGYAYKIGFTGADITGTKGGEEQVVVDLVVGVPALATPEKVPPFTFSALYQNRLMLGAMTSGAEGNRMDFSVSNAPDVFNGTESSMNGQLSLYFGGVEDITCATQLYNRFGAGIFSMLLVLKDTEVYLLTGSSPEDFVIYPVSQTVGCPAPLTLAVAEVGFEVGQGLSRNVAIWLSNAGPVMFDGAILSPIAGIENYFDPNESEYIEWDSVARSRGWIDQTYKEYNVLIPSTSGQTDCNIWLVYDLRRKKWFRKDTGTASFPQAAWNVMNVTSGEQKVYGGIDDGTMIMLEDGTSWGETIAGDTLGTAITQKLRTGDFFPSENIWDECLIRKLKVISKRVAPTSNDHNLEVRYYKNTAQSSGSGVIFQDSNTANGVYVDFVDMDVTGDGTNETEWKGAASAVFDLSLDVGLERTVRLIQNLNRIGWAHAFEFEVATTDVQKGWQPIVWGIRYRIERKDDTDNT